MSFVERLSSFGGSQCIESLNAQFHGSAFGDFPDNAHPKQSQ